MNCDEARGKMISFVDGEVEAGTSRAIQAHLEECSSCARRVAFERNFNRLLQDGLATVEVPQDVVSGLRRRLDAEGRPGRRWLRNPLAAYAAAATLLLAFTLPAAVGLSPFQAVRRLWQASDSLSGTLVCIQCDRAHASIEDQRGCRSPEHQTGVRTADGTYWMLVQRGPGAELNGSPELRGTTVHLTGEPYPEIGMFDVRSFRRG